MLKKLFNGVQCFACAGKCDTGHRDVVTWSYWVVSSDKVRALKVVLSNGSNENGKFKMATDTKQQLCCYSTADLKVQQPTTCTRVCCF